MDDRLVLTLPAGTETLAPRKRYESPAKEARLNASAILPAIIAALIALVTKFFGSDPEPVRAEHAGSARTGSAPLDDWTSSQLSGEQNSKPEGEGAAQPAASVAVVEADGRTVSQFDSLVAANDEIRIASSSPNLPHPPKVTAEVNPVSGAGEVTKVTSAGSSGTATQGRVANDNKPEPEPQAGEHGSTPVQAAIASADPKTPEQLGEETGDKEGLVRPEPSQPGPREDRAKATVNRAPLVAAPIVLGTGFLNESITISLADLLHGAIDPDGDRLSLKDLRPSSGKLQLVEEGRWAYVPDQDVSGDVTFSYQVSDGTIGVVQTAHLLILPQRCGEIVGTSGNDDLRGTPGRDVIAALGGDDIVTAGEADDIVTGGLGNDRIFGGDGDDTLYGSMGHDVIFGGQGNDDLFGNEGNDTVSGERGNDDLFGEEGEDTLSGGDGDDRLLGGDGDDQLDGGNGNDVLAGGNGSDKLAGGPGDDHLLGEAGDDELDGGSGDDLLDGGDGNDVLAGGGGQDDLVGGDGDDVLDGQGGDDVLAGESGDDVMFGGTGADVLNGGLGDDDLLAGAGDDSLAGDEGEDFLSGGAGKDVLEGGHGDDTLSGDEGHDVLAGEAGDDVLMGREGDDRLSGGDGDDVLDGGQGDDEIDAGEGDDVIVFTDSDGDDLYVGGTGMDCLDLSNIIFDTTIDLPDGWVESAGTGRDLIFEIENVQGGHGRDTLVADDAVNIMTGGAGADTFVFRRLDDLTNGGGPRDHIMDFSVGDRIDLSRLNSGRDDYATAKLFFGGYIEGDFSEVGQVAFRHNSLEEGGVYTVVHANLKNDSAADFELILEGQHELSERDFIFEMSEGGASV